MLHTEEVIYSEGGHNFRGFVSYDPSNVQPKPCVLVAHDWSGRNDFACNKAGRLASMGYVGFAVDMYGNAKLGHTNDEKRTLLTEVMEKRSQVSARMQAAFQKASTMPFVDPAKIAAIGYCFGGLCALDLTRSGANLRGVISFHGILTAPDAASWAKIKAKILVLHGYDDPLVPKEDVTKFASEMSAKKVDWQIHMYGGTQHSFTNPEANDSEMGLHYNATAADRSWTSASNFLSEIFK